MRIFKVLFVILMGCSISHAMAVDLRVYSGGPFESAFHEVAKDFEKNTGHDHSNNIYYFFTRTYAIR